MRTANPVVEETFPRRREALAYCFVAAGASLSTALNRASFGLLRRARVGVLDTITSVLQLRPQGELVEAISVVSSQLLDAGESLVDGGLHVAREVACGLTGLVGRDLDPGHLSSHPIGRVWAPEPCEPLAPARFRVHRAQSRSPSHAQHAAELSRRVRRVGFTQDAALEVASFC